MEERVKKMIDKELIERIEYLESKVKLYKKALELACVPRNDWDCREPKRIKYTSNYDYFVEEAKESMK